MFSKILVAIDDSAYSQSVFEQALAFAKLHQSRLMVLHVLTTPDNLYPGDPYIGITQIAMQAYWERWQDRQQQGISRLKTLEAEAIAVGVEMEFTQSIGDPSRMICDLAETWKSDLIVVGRRGVSGVSEFFGGSVSNYVLHHAPCHVLTFQDQVTAKRHAEAELLTSGARG
ncbi:MAG: universal stress protein [Alkalinema sp. CAN_BIN05]|nr:universal stress protein [Alkalinema sp. CAN_BIN05]